MIRRLSAEPQARPTVRRLALTDNERDSLSHGYRHLNFPTGLDADHEPFLQNSSRWLAELAPPRVLAAIRRWHLDSDRPGVLVIDNWGVDPELPPTPTDGRRSADKLTSYSEMVLAAVASLLGQPIGFADERRGDLVCDLTPVRGKEQALTNEGSYELGWHVEHNATGYLLGPHVKVVDYLTFFHLRGDPRGEAKTLVADIRDALPLLGRNEVETLRRPEFLFRPPLLVRAALPAELREIRNVSVLTGSLDDPHVHAALYGDLTEGVTPDARAALKELKAALDAVQRGVPTVEGRLVLVDNRRVLHARHPFHPAYDGRDRWLQRVMVTSNLDQLRPWQRHGVRVLTVG